jgi:fluoride ion exporter CrcB/FEX
MTDLLLVAIGGGFGCGVALLAARRWRTSFTPLRVNIPASALLGVFLASAPHPGATTPLLAYGALGSAAPFTSALAHLELDGQESPLTLIRRTAGRLVTHLVFCAAFFMAGYVGVQASVTLFHKLVGA